MKPARFSPGMANPVKVIRKKKFWILRGKKAARPRSRPQKVSRAGTGCDNQPCLDLMSDRSGRYGAEAARLACHPVSCGWGSCDKIGD